MVENCTAKWRLTSLESYIILFQIYQLLGSRVLFYDLGGGLVAKQIPIQIPRKYNHEDSWNSTTNFFFSSAELGSCYSR